MPVARGLSVRTQVFRAVAITLGLIVGTWTFFGPVMAWHHITVFGILGGIALNGEGPHDPIRPHWDDQDVIIHYDRLTNSAILWLFYCIVLFWITAKLARWADQNIFTAAKREGD